MSVHVQSAPRMSIGVPSLFFKLIVSESSDGIGEAYVMSFTTFVPAHTIIIPFGGALTWMRAKQWSVPVDRTLAGRLSTHMSRLE